MTIRGQYENINFTFIHSWSLRFWRLSSRPPLTVAGLSGDQTGKHTFEVRLASHEKVEDGSVPGPGLEKTTV